jgi:hypothetical protein
MRETLNEGTVEVAETQKTPDLFDRCRALPLCDALDLHRVHLDLSVAHDHPEVLDLSLGEETLLQLKVKIESFELRKDVVTVLFVFL